MGVSGSGYSVNQQKPELIGSSTQDGMAEVKSIFKDEITAFILSCGTFFSIINYYYCT